VCNVKEWLIKNSRVACSAGVFVAEAVCRMFFFGTIGSVPLKDPNFRYIP
jgi:hypothetical protein